MNPIAARIAGTETLAAALGRLGAIRARLHKERAKLEPDLPHAEKVYEIVTLNELHGQSYLRNEQRKMNTLMRRRRWLLRRMAEIDRQLTGIQKEVAAIKKHCKATDAEIEAQAAKWLKRLHDDECLKLSLKGLVAGMRRPRGTVQPQGG